MGLYNLRLTRTNPTVPMKIALLCSTLLALSTGFAGAQTAPAAAAAASAAATPIETKIASCIGCHGIKGYQASFPEVHKVPMIAGQDARYLAAALNAYKKGDRKHPTMRAIAGTLSDADITDISAYYQQQARPAAAPEQPAPAPDGVAALLAKGACASCHGANYSKPVDGTYPKIAGQHADYLYVALKSYKTDGSAQVGRNNAIMSAQVKQFTLAELKAMANYLGALPSDLAIVPQSKFR